MPRHVAFLCLALAGCASAVPRPGPDEVAFARRIDPTADEARLERGRGRFVARCAGCHSLPEPASLHEASWTEELDRMEPKAKLGTGERRDVELYLRAVAGRAAARR